MPESIRVVGLNKAITALQAIGVPKKEIAQASKDAANIVATEARTLVPVRSGKLRDSIRVGGAQRKVVVRAGNETSVPYGNPIHWGWVRRGIKRNAFFSKAIKKNLSKIQEQYFSEIKRLAEKYNATKK